MTTLKNKGGLKRNGLEGEDLQFDEKNDVAARLVIDKMNQAFLKDSASNKEGKPGLAKLLISNEVFTDLRKKDVQELFIERGGLSSFVNWL